MSCAHAWPRWRDDERAAEVPSAEPRVNTRGARPAFTPQCLGHLLSALARMMRLKAVRVSSHDAERDGGLAAMTIRL